MSSKNEVKNPLGDAFFLGVNYWASHAGIYMWRDWNAEAVDEDMRQLSACGLRHLRVFPLWPDFQPISYLYAGGGEYRDYEASEPVYEPGALSVRMMDHFLEFAALAEKHGIKLIVGLITGWMSGRLFVPPALQGRNILTDPESIMWQTRFVDAFVRRTKHCKSILAWDLGNECNCMQNDMDRTQAWCWTAAVSNAIRVADGSRPIVSGMHSLRPNHAWTMQDQGELTDVLTTHPYPLWVEHCMEESLHEIRSTLHASAETRFYADVGGKPCFAEEIGSMGPMIACDKNVSAFWRATLASLWANHCGGAMWWCAYDQNQLNYAPYKWVACEGELGLFTYNREKKPMVDVLVDFQNRLEKLQLAQLPAPNKQAVCVLADHPDVWAVALGAYILSKQAGFDITFCCDNQDIPEAELYIVPSLKGSRGLAKDAYRLLMERVSQGAQLYVSMDDSFVLEHERLFGAQLQFRRNRTAPANVSISDCEQLSVPCQTKLVMEPTSAHVHYRETDGTPVLISNTFGRGKAWFCTLPIESIVGARTDAPHEIYFSFYRAFAADALQLRLVAKQRPELCVTEHMLSETTACCILINHSTQDISETLTVHSGWQTEGGNSVCDISLPANDWTCVYLKRK